MGIRHASSTPPRHLRGGHTQRETDRDNAAGGRAGDQVEIPSDGVFEVLLQVGQKGRWEGAPNTAAVDRQNPLQ